MNAQRARLFRGGIYPILDADFVQARGMNLLSEARQFLESQPPLLQVRAKSFSSAEYQRILKQLVPLANQQNTLLIANDHAESAAASGCAGVHVGQSDLGVTELRQRFPQLLVGLSTHNFEQFVQGLQLKPDYIALGPLFETSSKKNAEPAVGLELLAELAPLAEQAQVPLVTIGGIQAHAFPKIAPHADWVAMISNLYLNSNDQNSTGQAQSLALSYHSLDDQYVKERLKCRPTQASL